MVTFSSDTTKDISEGVTRGIIKEARDGISELISKWLNQEIAFVQNSKTIELIKEQRRSGEIAQYKVFIKDPNILNLIVMGLTLRRLDNSENIERMQDLRGKLFLKYKLEGLHIAQVVQIGILNRYIVILLENGASTEDVKIYIKSFLVNIERHVCFVSSEHVVEQVVDEVRIKILSHNPDIFILSGTGNAMAVTFEACRNLKESNLPYVIETYSSPKRELYFFTRILKL